MRRARPLRAADVGGPAAGPSRTTMPDGAKVGRSKGASATYRSPTGRLYRVAGPVDSDGLLAVEHLRDGQWRETKHLDSRSAVTLRHTRTIPAHLGGHVARLRADALERVDG